MYQYLLVHGEHMDYGHSILELQQIHTFCSRYANTEISADEPQ